MKTKLLEASIKKIFENISTNIDQIVKEIYECENIVNENDYKFIKNKLIEYAIKFRIAVDREKGLVEGDQDITINKLVKLIEENDMLPLAQRIVTNPVSAIEAVLLGGNKQLLEAYYANEDINLGSKLYKTVVGKLVKELDETIKHKCKKKSK